MGLEMKEAGRTAYAVRNYSQNRLRLSTPHPLRNSISRYGLLPSAAGVVSAFTAFTDVSVAELGLAPAAVGLAMMGVRGVRSLFRLHEAVETVAEIVETNRAGLDFTQQKTGMVAVADIAAEGASEPAKTHIIKKPFSPAAKCDDNLRELLQTLKVLKEDDPGGLERVVDGLSKRLGAELWEQFFAFGQKEGVFEKVEPITFDSALREVVAVHRRSPHEASELQKRLKELGVVFAGSQKGDEFEIVDALLSLKEADSGIYRKVCGYLGEKTPARFRGISAYLSSETMGPNLFSDEAIIERGFFDREKRYRIERKHSTGSVGVVFLAWDTYENRKVAIKVLLESAAAQENFRRRFINEGRGLRMFKITWVVEIYETGNLGGRPYFIMEFVGGGNLFAYTKKMHEEHRFDETLVLKIFLRLCVGLEEIAKRGIVHRDIKPENILMFEQRKVPLPKFADFGIMKTKDEIPREEGETKILDLKTLEGKIIGTPAYMSPEQACGLPLDFRSDIFSLGAVFYYVFTGDVLFKAETDYQTAYRIASLIMEPKENKDLARKNLAKSLEKIPYYVRPLLEKMLAPEPENRYQRHNELLGDLANAIKECRKGKDQ